MAKVETARERFGDFFPSIDNCSVGMHENRLHGKLTSDQITKVKSIPVSDQFSNQEALSITGTCSHQGKVEILYYPSTNGFNPNLYESPTIIVGALCSKADCEYNTSKKK
ncbi:hypothetical protein KJ570_01870 [Patescibacteria group bacterium]|nr:hypothetical protein [Patescibacteria group bacterium]MBU2035850.1 hypothetical protein [Patescibacteria group bacterium]